MDINALKLELVQRLTAMDDMDVLVRVREFLLLNQGGALQYPEEVDADLLAAANLFGATAYAEDDLDVSDLELRTASEKT